MPRMIKNGCREKEMVHLEKGAERKQLLSYVLHFSGVKASQRVPGVCVRGAID